jgi:hypothetical protein
MKLRKILFTEDNPFFVKNEVEIVADCVFICGTNGVGKNIFLELLGFSFSHGVYKDRGTHRKIHSRQSVDFSVSSPSDVEALNFSVDLMFEDNSRNLRKWIEKYKVEFSTPVNDVYSIQFLNSGKINETQKTVDCCIYEGYLYKYYFVANAKFRDPFELRDWSSWCKENIPLIVKFFDRLCRNVKLRRGVQDKLPGLYSVLEKIYNAVPAISSLKSIGIVGLQEAISRQLSMAELNLLLLLLEIEEFNNGEATCIAIDEPELGWAISNHVFFIKFIKAMIKEDSQIFVATHSAEILNYALGSESHLVLGMKKEGPANKASIEKLTENNSAEYAPHIFGIYDENSFIRIYQEIARLSGAKSVQGVDCWLLSNDVAERKFDKYYDKETTLIVYIRNAIHHAGENDRIYSHEELTSAINSALNVLSSKK